MMYDFPLVPGSNPGGPTRIHRPGFQLVDHPVFCLVGQLENKMRTKRSLSEPLSDVTGSTGMGTRLPREQVRYWLENRRKECPRTPFLDVMKTIHI